MGFCCRYLLVFIADNAFAVMFPACAWDHTNGFEVGSCGEANRFSSFITAIRGAIFASGFISATSAATSAEETTTAATAAFLFARLLATAATAATASCHGGSRDGADPFTATASTHTLHLLLKEPDILSPDRGNGKAHQKAEKGPAFLATEILPRFDAEAGAGEAP